MMFETVVFQTKCPTVSALMPLLLSSAARLSTMSLVFLPMMIALGICLVPIWLLPGRNLQRAREYFITSQPTPPDVMRNCSVAYPLRIAAFGPFFVWGASGGVWAALL